MEPKFQTSFIPKSPIVDMSSRTRPIRSTNIFSVIATVLFILTLIASISFFVYRNVLLSQISDADKELNTARAAFEPAKIQELIDANTRIITIKGLLEKHVVTSQLLALLEQLIVKNVRIDVLEYDNKGTEASVTVDLESQTFGALATQSEIFSKNEFMKDQDFSNFNLGTNGIIKTKFYSKIDTKLVSYKKAVESLSMNQ